MSISRRNKRIDKFYQQLEQAERDREAAQAAAANMTVEEYRLAQMASAKMRLMTYRPPDDQEEYRL
jgi:hypothetical protein